MTQASLSPDLDSGTSAQAPEPSAEGRMALGAEATLWLFGLTSMTLVFASLLLLGLLAQGVIADAGTSGFLTALAVVTSVLGLGALLYVFGSARRAGYLSTPEASIRQAASQVSTAGTGLIVAPAVPAGFGAHKRQQQRQAQQVRSRRARAIAIAEAARRAASQQPTRPDAAVPRTARPTPPGSVPSTTVRPVRPTAPRPIGPATPGVARPAAARPVRVMPPARPQSAVDTARPPSAPPAFLRMRSPAPHPRVQPAFDQIRMAEMRASRPTRPWSIIETADGAQIYQPPQRVDAA